MAHVEEGKTNVKFICSDQKKNIFLIGDSIRMGYCRQVKEELSDAAEVFYPEENCRSTQNVIVSLFGWSNLFDDPAKVDVVQFNCGHWDAARWSGELLSLTSEEEYGRNVRMIIRMITKLFPKAKIIFATTTPMNPDGQQGGNTRTTEEIARYNEIAKAAVQENAIPVNDLFAATQDWDSSCYADYCHFTAEANETLGKAVANALRRYL